jgi:cytochrome oxidase Cu insertion factor (SCO1/SenC/PrrC family)
MERHAPPRPRGGGGSTGSGVLRRSHTRDFALIKDKIVLLNFMYARCRGVCIPVTSNLLRVQKLLGDRVGRDIFMYSFTLDPAEDTPDVLRAYARAEAIAKEILWVDWPAGARRGASAG